MRVTAHNVQRSVGWFALLLAVLVAVFGYVDQTERTNLANQVAAKSSCQTKVNQEFLAVIKQRAMLSMESTSNIDALIEAVFTAKDSTAAEADYKKYVAELDKINGELKRATYPSIGNC